MDMLMVAGVCAVIFLFTTSLTASAEQFFQKKEKVVEVEAPDTEEAPSEAS